MNVGDENISGAEMSVNVLELLRVAHEYCLFVENMESRSMEETITFFRKLGPLLYLKGALLPWVEPENPETDERFVTEEEWQAVFNEFRGKLTNLDEFWHIDHEGGLSYEAIKASLSENFADIYQDMKDFVLLYSKNTRDARQNAVHDCSLLFESRWGVKMLENLRYVHYLLNRARIEREEDL